MFVKVSKIKINNFRSIKNVCLDLDDYTILVGKNNCGKSNIVKAINLAFSFSNVDKEDIFVSTADPFEYSRKIIIDVKVIPINQNGHSIKSFDDKWTLAFGDSIMIDESEDNEYFAFRTEIGYDGDKEYYLNKKMIITNWKDEEECEIGRVISKNVLEYIDCIFVNAQRDISADIKDRNSLWSKMTSKISVPITTRKKIEKQINLLNGQIVNKSEILRLIKNTLKSTMADEECAIDISPITKDIESLYKGMDIYYGNEESVQTSVENVGLGVRSWAVFSTTKAALLSKAKKRNEQETAYNPLILIEEPEAHVHPQAQRQLFNDLKGMIGQKVITTHSPYILSQVSLEKIRYVKKNGASTEVLSLLIDGLESEDIRKINRTVMNTRGEILYANAVILAEGETEEQALAIFLREYFHKEPFELGINIIGVGGNNYLPFMRVLNFLGIKWYVFSDGETRPVDDLKKCIRNLEVLDTNPDLADYGNIFVLENGNCIETYFLEQGYKVQIKRAINKVEDRKNYMGYYIKQYNNQKGKGGVLRNYTSDSDGGYARAIRDCMISSGNKTKYAVAIAEEICNMKTKQRRIPPMIKKLFEKIKEDLMVGDK